MARTSCALPLYANVELRAMTSRPSILERSVIRSSVMPSAKYPCCGSPLMLSNGSTAIEGLPAGADVATCAVGVADGPGLVAVTGATLLDCRSHTVVPMPHKSATADAASATTRRGSLRAGVDAAFAGDDGAPSSRTENARTGSAMFLTACMPRSSNDAAIRLLTAPRTASDTMIPPGSASAWRRAAMLTPSPYRSPSAFSITSPR